jgi:glycosyltransferase involved in cell wall biosynthesis
MLDGVALAVQNYARWLQRNHRPVCVVTVKTPGYTDDAPYPVYRYASIPVPMRKPYRYGVPQIDCRFRRQLRSLPFSLIHAHCPFSSARLALEVARRRKIPLVATFHSKYQDDFERAFHSKRLAKWMVRKVIAFYEKADEVWIPQAAVEDTIRAYGFKGKVVVVENGCDFIADEQHIAAMKQQARDEMHLPADVPVFLFVGQHIWEKNTRLIIEALAAMNDVPFRMFFIGTGYAAKEMQALAAQYGLTPKVQFLGVVADRELLKRYYTAADLFLFPSLYDNAPLVVREAAALHTPAVLVARATAAEIVTDNYNGFLTDNSSEALTARIRELIQTPETIRQAGRHAARTIARSWENVTEEVMERYAQLMERHASTR